MVVPQFSVTPAQQGYYPNIYIYIYIYIDIYIYTCICKPTLAEHGLPFGRGLLLFRLHGFVSEEQTSRKYVETQQVPVLSKPLFMKRYSTYTPRKSKYRLIHKYQCICFSMSICLHIYIYIYIRHQYTYYICINKCVCVYVYMYMYIYIYKIYVGLFIPFRGQLGALRADVFAGAARPSNVRRDRGRGDGTQSSGWGGVGWGGVGWGGVGWGGVGWGGVGYPILPLSTHWKESPNLTSRVPGLKSLLGLDSLSET